MSSHAMPNGHRESFRWPNDQNNPPSPIHTSDSEETENYKWRYYDLVSHVLRHWRHFLRIVKFRRGLLKMFRDGLFPSLTEVHMRHVVEYISPRRKIELGWPWWP